MQQKLVAFHNDPQLRLDLIAEVKRHRLEDQIMKGRYDNGGSNGDWKGCGVGCSIHSLNKIRGTHYNTGGHAHYEEGFGVPRQLAYLQDHIFENLQDGLHLVWPEQFWTAIQPGADLEMVTPRFVHWLLTDSLSLVKEEWKDVREVFTQTIALYERWIAGDKPSDDDFLKVADRAALAALADLADRAALAARADRAALAALADLADRADLAARAALAALAALADLADLADRADRADLADLAKQQSEKLLELLASAPVPSGVAA